VLAIVEVSSVKVSNRGGNAETEKGVLGEGVVEAG
jgi:hypothetical protein